MVASLITRLPLFPIPHFDAITLEDSRVAVRMAEPQAEALCRRLAGDLVYQVEQYRQNGFEVVGVVGINGSLVGHPLTSRRIND
jgi:hypothetical protein